MIKDIRVKSCIPNFPESPDIGQNSGQSISAFWISVQFLINENSCSSRTSNDIDMKLEQQLNLTRERRQCQKKFNEDFVLVDFKIIVIFAIYDQFVPTRKPESGRIVCKSYIFIDSNLLSYEN